jgi:hypothetical protein
VIPSLVVPFLVRYYRMKNELLYCHYESPSFHVPKHEGVYSGKFVTDDKKISQYMFLCFSSHLI